MGACTGESRGEAASVREGESVAGAENGAYHRDGSDCGGGEENRDRGAKGAHGQIGRLPFRLTASSPTATHSARPPPRSRASNQRSRRCKIPPTPRTDPRWN